MKNPFEVMSNEEIKEYLDFTKSSYGLEERLEDKLNAILEINGSPSIRGWFHYATIPLLLGEEFCRRWRDGTIDINGNSI